MPAALISILKGIGLTIGETVVLGILIKEGNLTAAKIAKAAHMKRPTIYDTLKELVQKGLVSEIRDGAVLQFQAIDTDLLPNYISRKREELQKREEQLRAVLPELRAMRRGRPELPGIHIREGVVTQPQSAKRLSSILPGVHDEEIFLSEKETTFVRNGEAPVSIIIEDAQIASLMQRIFTVLGNKP